MEHETAQQKCRQAIDINKDFLKMTWLAKDILAAIDKWDHMKLKTSAQQRQKL